jgi:hypothetical protein
LTLSETKSVKEYNSFWDRTCDRIWLPET